MKNLIDTFNNLEITKKSTYKLKDFLIEDLQTEFIKLHLKKTPTNKKKYLINQNVRINLQEYNYTTIGIIPYFSNQNNIINFNKKYYINTTNLIINNNNNIITYTTRCKKREENKSEYLNFIEENINNFLQKEFNINNIKKSNISKILDIEKSKIIIYSININNNINITNNFILKKYIDFYNINKIINKTDYNKKLFKKKKFKKKIYNDILNNTFNTNNLQNLIHLFINDKDFIQIKIYTIYNNLYN